MKYYGVRVGAVPGVYDTWEKCKKQVDGYSGAQFKSFHTYKEAEDYVNSKDCISYNESKSDVVAYTDGSYDPDSGIFAYGVVILIDGKEITFSRAFFDKEKALMRNVAGEIEGAKEIMGYCYSHNIKSVDIYYDYEGIEKWCTGEWRATKKETQMYRAYYDAVSRKVKINFIKVKSHSGNKYNDMADSLAKEAVKTMPVV